MIRTKKSTIRANNVQTLQKNVRMCAKIGRTLDIFRNLLKEYLFY